MTKANGVPPRAAGEIDMQDAGRAPDNDWGCLHVWCDAEDAFARVRRAVIAAYEGHGLSLIEWSDPHNLPVSLGAIPALAADAFDAPGELDEDEVLVLVEPTDGWIAVMSRRWEWARPLGHPLAELLSRDFEVLSITSVANRYAEITRYQGGHAVQSSITGPDAPALTEGVAPLDLGWFDGRGAAIPAQELGEYLWDPERFGALAGPDAQGHRDAFESAPLADYAREEYLIFRRP